MHLEGSTPDFAKQLRVWGEAGSAKLKKPGSTKIEYRGYIFMLLGILSPIPVILTKCGIQDPGGFVLPET
jgi:hypothetical protein